MAKKSTAGIARPQARGQRPHIWLVGPDPVLRGKYLVWLQQRNQAQWRDEVWTLSFPDWVDKWGDLYDQRGRERGCYCMTRIDREQPWTRENTHVISRHDHAQIQNQRMREGVRSDARERAIERRNRRLSQGLI